MRLFSPYLHQNLFRSHIVNSVSLTIRRQEDILRESSRRYVYRSYNYDYNYFNNYYTLLSLPQFHIYVIPACLPAVLLEGPESFRWLLRRIPAGVYPREYGGGDDDFGLKT
jgi:hypothetical protein